MAPYEIYGGMAYLSNSFNGVPGARAPLLGWDTTVAFPAWHNLRFKVDATGYFGINDDAKQKTYFVMGGGEYSHVLFRERVYAHALFGDGGINRYWGPPGTTGATASFSVLLGGGLDTPISRHFALRVEGDLQHTNFALIQSVANAIPYRTPGLPNYFGRISTGLVWAPRLGRSAGGAVLAGRGHGPPPESDLIVEEANSFGHWHIFASSWWSYLSYGGVEYDRNSWGTLLGGRLDYVAEVMPVAILRQPTSMDIWGVPNSNARTAVPGLAISPIGMRLLWRDTGGWKPFYEVNAGMIGFSQKALSWAATYEDFTLRQSVGMQFRVNDRMDVRTAVSDLHFSNAFLVPSNPGIDEMMYDVGIAYHLHGRSEVVR